MAEDLNGKADNLLRAFENNSDPDGLIFQRLRTRMFELDKEIADLSQKLAELRENAPEPPTDNVGLLDHLPLVEVDLNEMAADRLRRFLEAFRVEIHYDVRTRRATLKAEISAHLIEELTRVAQWGRPRPDLPESGGSHSSELCPRQDSNLRHRLRRAVLYPLSYGGSATQEE